MNKNFFLYAAALAASSFSLADTDKMHSYDYDMDHKEKNQATMDSYDYAQKNMITPAVYPVKKDDMAFTIEGDFIYWSAIQGNNLIGDITNEPSFTETNDLRFSPGGPIGFLNKYSPGFKVAADLFTSEDGWDILARYTWYKTTQNRPTIAGVTEQGPGQLQSSLLGMNTVDPFVAPDIADYSSSITVKGSWELKYNEFDLELGRNFFVSKSLQLRPFFGLKGGWQDQIRKTYWTISDPTGEDSPPEWETALYNTNETNDNWNIGLRGGLNTSWLLTKNFSLFGDLALSTLWTKFTVNRSDTATTTGSSAEEENVANFQTNNTRNIVKGVYPVMEMLFGLRYDTWFSDDSYRLRLEAAWENQVWFDTYRFELINSSGVANLSGNLSMQGLTARASFAF